MKLFLAPEDVWLFRDGRPFDAASSHRARSLFPPYPSVLQGVIRSHHLVVNNLNFNERSSKMKDEIKQLVGDATDYKSLEIRGPFVATYQDGKLTRYFSRPSDWFPIKGDDRKIQSLTPRSRDEAVTSATDERGNYLLPQLLLPPDDFKPGKKEYGEWLTYEDLKEYLQGNPVTPAASETLFLRESRVGIQIKAGNRTVEQGMLYEAEFVRPLEGAGLYLEVSGYDGWQQTGMIKIGGESHAARYHQITEDVEQLDLPKTIKGKFKVYFATPAYFKNGWQPSNWSQFFGIELKPEAVALKGYETIGGFDYAAHGDKPSRRYVPAGSVYYFDSEDQEIRINSPFTEDMGRIGFGQVVIAEWK